MDCCGASFDAPGKIKHVVVLMVENSSFDRNFGCLARVIRDLDGDTRNVTKEQRDSKGNVYVRAPGATNVFDPPHHEVSMSRCLEGDWIKAAEEGPPTVRNKERLAEVLKYFEDGELPASHELARHFVVCDRWFSSVAGPTWPNRLFAMSGTAKGVLVMPGEQVHGTSILDNLKDFRIAAARYNQWSIFDELEANDIPFRVYAGDVPLTLLLDHEFSLKRIRQQKDMAQFFKDAAGPADAFPAFAWVEPSHLGREASNFHPPNDVHRTEALLASVYNAIRSNDELWESTLLIFTFDENGGFYDHVPPPPAVAPDHYTHHYSFDQLGFRVPTLLISQHLKHGVDHTVYDHTSILKLVCVALSIVDDWLEAFGRATGEAPRKHCDGRSCNLFNVGDGGRTFGKRTAVANDPIDCQFWSRRRGLLKPRHIDVSPEYVAAMNRSRGDAIKRSKAEEPTNDLSGVLSMFAKRLPFGGKKAPAAKESTESYDTESESEDEATGSTAASSESA